MEALEEGGLGGEENAEGFEAHKKRRLFFVSYKMIFCVFLWCFISFIDNNYQTRAAADYMKDWGMEKKDTFNFKCDLDPDKFKVDEPSRKLSKLLLNSFYGRWGMRGQRPKVNTYKKDDDGIKDMYDFFRDAIDGGKYEIKKFVNLPKAWQITYKVRDEDNMAKNTNLPIASFTTSYARVLLHRIMRHVGMENVVYSDTDSVIFKFQPKDNCIGNIITCKAKDINGKNKTILLNSCLGGLTDELDGAGHITEFIGLAPKTYSYELQFGNEFMKSKSYKKLVKKQKIEDGDLCKYETKAKGYSLDNISKQVICFDSMKYLIKNMKFKKEDNTIESKIPINGYF